MRIALSGAHIFAWIFIFQYYYSTYGAAASALSALALTYALTQVIIVLVTPWSAAKMRGGIKRLMMYAVLCAAAAFVVLGAGFSGFLGNIGWSIGLFAVLMGLYRGLYWVPYEISRSPATSGSIWREIIIALVPFAAGASLALGTQAPLVLLFAAGVVMLLSIFSLSGMSDAHEGFAWKYRQTFHELFAASHRLTLLETLFDGLEGTALLLLWPILVFMLAGWSYGTVGAIISVTLLCTLAVRRLRQRSGVIVTPTVGATLAASAWLMRLLVATPVGVVLLDTYFHGGSRSMRGVDAFAYEQSADNTTYVDEYTALKEMGQALGRIIMCLLVAVLCGTGSFTIPIVAAFCVAAAAAFVSIMFIQTAQRRAF